jgi:hypothetical protein
VPFPGNQCLGAPGGLPLLLYKTQGISNSNMYF